jgi:uncharacterized membrane protein YczE
MLPFPSKSELVRRVPRLVLGLVLFGLGLALMVVADLGLGPWEVFHQGISDQTGIPIGTVGIITGALVLFLWIPLHERIGLGTLLNVVVIGVVIDLTLLVLEEPSAAAAQWTYLLLGLLAVGVGSGYYIGAGLGPGPRDGLMTGLARRGHSVALARTGIEVAALVAGALLGGTVGVGTILYAFGMGPLVAYFLPRLTVRAPLIPGWAAERP